MNLLLPFIVLFTTLHKVGLIIVTGSTVMNLLLIACIADDIFLRYENELVRISCKPNVIFKI